MTADDVRFFTGMHQPSDADKLDDVFISRNRLMGRKSDFKVGNWIMDSAAFTTIQAHGGYPHGVEEYAEQIKRWKKCGNLLAAVAQDYMCEAHMLKITGMTIADHQRLTIERYDALMACNVGVYILPVLQGYEPEDYVSHLRQYGSRFPYGMWVGVGSVCKRNGAPRAIENVLLAIKRERPDLRLHGFGIKKTALGSGLVRELLHTADSMAWSYAARVEGRDGNSYKEAIAYQEKINTMPYQRSLLGPSYS